MKIQGQGNCICVLKVVNWQITQLAIVVECGKFNQKILSNSQVVFRKKLLFTSSNNDRIVKEFCQNILHFSTESNYILTGFFIRERGGGKSKNRGAISNTRSFDGTSFFSHFT